MLRPYSSSATSLEVRADSAWAGGFGFTPRTAAEIFSAGVDVITLGNHVGMLGPYDSVIGNDGQGMLQRFLTQLPVRHESPSKLSGPVSFNSVVLEIKPETGTGLGIRRVDIVDSPAPEEKDST